MTRDNAADRLCENCGKVLIGSWPSDDLRRAFTAGAKWWEFFKSGGTMWATDCDRTEAEAERRYAKPQGAPESAEAADPAREPADPEVAEPGEPLADDGAADAVS